MAFQYKLVEFQSPAATGVTSVTGVGFTPKGFIFFGTRTAGTQGQPFCIRVGVDDLTNRAGRAINGGNFGGGNFGDGYIDITHSIVAMRVQALNELMLSAYVSAVNADGFDITWDFVLVATGVTFYGIVFGGAGVNVKAGISHFVVGSNSVNTVGFRPTALFGFELSQNSSVVLPDGCSLSMGFAGDVACGQTTVSGGFLSTNTGVSKCNGYLAEDEWITVIDQGTGSIVRKTVVASLDASGFTVTQTVGGSWYAWIAINGCAVNVGTFIQQAATGPQAVPLIAGSPKMVVLFGRANALVGSSSTDAEFCFGAKTLTPANEGKFLFTGALDGYPPANVHVMSTEGSGDLLGFIYEITGNQAGTQTNLVDLSSFTTGQMGLNWLKSDGDGRAWAYAVFADTGAQACGAIATGSIVVTKNTTPIAGGETEFTYTTTGGLSPSTFVLSDGESQTFTGLAPGTYGVTEVPVSGWTTAYTVSNGNPHTALVINANSITVTVLNTFVSTTSQLRRYRRWSLPYDGNKQIFIPRIEIISQMGVGNSDDTDPVMFLRLSPDGGSTWGPYRQMPLGASGDTMIRSYLTRFGQLRNPVAELICDAPVFVAWIRCELPQGFSVGSS